MNPINRALASVVEHLPKPLVRRVAMRYIAGEGLDDACRVVRVLNAKRIMATLDILGENVTSRDEAVRAAASCERVLKTIHENCLDANLSLKLTQLGLKLDEEFCYSNLRDLLHSAGRYKNFVRIDMEDSTTTTATLNLYERLRSEGIENMGVVIQAYLKRSEDDLTRLLSMKANVRLCKGAYVEPETIAFQDRGEIRSNYLKLLRMILRAGSYVGIATHDETLVRGALEAVQENQLDRSRYEFQMLHGVKVTLREALLKEGHRLRVYVPFGQEWYAYSMRRFNENPRMAWTVLGALFSRN